LYSGLECYKQNITDAQIDMCPEIFFKLVEIWSGKKFIPVPWTCKFKCLPSLVLHLSWQSLISWPAKTHCSAQYNFIHAPSAFWAIPLFNIQWNIYALIKKIVEHHTDTIFQLGSKGLPTTFISPSNHLRRPLVH